MASMSTKIRLAQNCFTESRSGPACRAARTRYGLRPRAHTPTQQTTRTRQTQPATGAAASSHRDTRPRRSLHRASAAAASGDRRHDATRRATDGPQRRDHRHQPTGQCIFQCRCLVVPDGNRDGNADEQPRPSAPTATTEARSATRTTELAPAAPVTIGRCRHHKSDSILQPVERQRNSRFHDSTIPARKLWEKHRGAGPYGTLHLFLELLAAGHPAQKNEQGQARATHAPGHRAQSSR